MIRPSGFLSGEPPPSQTDPSSPPYVDPRPPQQVPAARTLTPPIPMDSKLVFKVPPPLDSAWLAYEKSANLLAPPAIVDPKDRQRIYSQKCRDLNAHLLSGRDKDLNDGIIIYDTQIETSSDPNCDDSLGLPIRSKNPSSPPAFANNHFIPIRSYNPVSFPSGPSFQQFEAKDQGQEGSPIVIYYHGGGLCVGDLDSEDMTCRRICKSLQCTVYSCDYRLMPDYCADAALSDAVRALMSIASTRKGSRLVVMGSSSGGQLAAQVSQRFRNWRRPKIHGVLLRAPFTCDSTEGGAHLPARFRGCHISMSEPFHTSLLSSAAVTSRNRTSEALPLEAKNLRGLPRHWIQVSTNDIYYSDGACYAEALREAGVDVKLDVVEGWPHTFWLKAPELERAVQAEEEMIEGLRWLLEGEVEDDKKENETGRFELI